MNKEENVVYGYDVLVDFKGDQHFITVCAVTRSIKENILIETAYYEIPVKKIISLGVSICNPIDSNDTAKGRRIAYNKALENLAPSVYVNCSGIASDEVVNTLIQQELNYVITNPNKFIKGYNDAWKRWEKRKRIREELESLSPDEKKVIELINNGVDVTKCISLAHEKVGN